MFPSREPYRPSAAPAPPEATDPNLPVAGEGVWTTAEGLRVTSRYAVHAVRRLAGATVLDWSVTPLSAPGLKPGDDLPGAVDLGLASDSPGGIEILLVDPAARRVYRPISLKSRLQFNRCLCTPLWAAQLTLRIGETRLLQVTYPELPARTAQVDVDFTTMPVIPQVPISPLGQVPTARQPTDLRRPVDEAAPLTSPYVLAVDVRGRPRRVLSITVDAIEAGPRHTSLRWTVRALADQPAFDLVPRGAPIAQDLTEDWLVYNPSSASGPRLRIGSTTLGAVWMTARIRGPRYVECLCTGFGIWAAGLRKAGGAATVTTTFPALPAAARSVDVVLPGATTLARLPVRRTTPAAAGLGPPQPAAVGRWTYDTDRPPPGWRTSAWPTPLPDLTLLDDYNAIVESIVPVG